MISIFTQRRTNLSSGLQSPQHFTVPLNLSSPQPLAPSMSSEGLTKITNNLRRWLLPQLEMRLLTRHMAAQSWLWRTGSHPPFKCVLLSPLWKTATTTSILFTISRSPFPLARVHFKIICCLLLYLARMQTLQMRVFSSSLPQMYPKLQEHSPRQDRHEVAT